MLSCHVNGADSLFPPGPLTGRFSFRRMKRPRLIAEAFPDLTVVRVIAVLNIYRSFRLEVVNHS